MRRPIATVHSTDSLGSDWAATLMETKKPGRGGAATGVCSKPAPSSWSLHALYGFDVAELIAGISAQSEVGRGRGRYPALWSRGCATNVDGATHRYRRVLLDHADIVLGCGSALGRIGNDVDRNPARRNLCVRANVLRQRKS